MADEKTKWLRDLLIIPVIVGLIVGLMVPIVNFFLPRIFEKKRELSYRIKQHVSMSQNSLQYLESEDVRVAASNGFFTDLMFYQVRIWNSGHLPIKNIPVRIVFDPLDKSNFKFGRLGGVVETGDFKILAVSHQTNPKYEFGQIIETGSDLLWCRFIYELLNPNDEDFVSFTTSSPATITVYAKAEGLCVKRIEIKPTIFSKYFAVNLAITAAFLVIIVRSLMLLKDYLRFVRLML